MTLEKSELGQTAKKETLRKVGNEGDLAELGRRQAFGKLETTEANTELQIRPTFGLSASWEAI